MKRRGIWLLAVIALFSTACHQEVPPEPSHPAESVAPVESGTVSQSVMDSTRISSSHVSSQTTVYENISQTGTNSDMTVSTRTTATRPPAQTIRTSTTSKPATESSAAVSAATRSVTQPTQADPWKYPYDIAAMEAECRSYAESLGWVWKKSLTLTNSSWNGNVSTYPFTKYPDEVTRTLKEAVYDTIQYQDEYYQGGKSNLNLLFMPDDEYPGDYLIYTLAD